MYESSPVYLFSILTSICAREEAFLSLRTKAVYLLQFLGMCV